MYFWNGIFDLFVSTTSQMSVGKGYNIPNYHGHICQGQCSLQGTSSMCIINIYMFCYWLVD